MSGVSLTRMTAATDRALAMKLSIFFRKLEAAIMFRRLLLIVVAGFLPLQSPTVVLRIKVKSRADLLAGKSFGSAGPYEKLSGKIYFAIEPRNSANQIIADIDKASKNSSGKVEFSSDFYIIKPKDLNRGNGAVLYEVSNRGNKG